MTRDKKSNASPVFEKLDGALVFLRRLPALERTKISSPATLPVDSSGVEPVFALSQLSDHLPVLNKCAPVGIAQRWPVQAVISKSPAQPCATGEKSRCWVWCGSRLA